MNSRVIIRAILIFIISELLLTTIFLLPQPARADGPICSSPNLAIPDGLSTDYDTPTPIPGPEVKDTIIVDAPGVIQDMDVVISTTHPFAGDLIFTLTHKIGPTETGAVIYHLPLLGNTAVTITTEPGCSGDNIDLTLDDEATEEVQTDCMEGYQQNDGTQAYTVGGFYKPFSSLSVFDGQILSGTWELAITDNFKQDQGTLHQWCLAPTMAAVDLEISNSDNPSSATPGGAIAYTLHYSNTGALTTTGVTLSEVVPTGTSFNAAASSLGWSCPNGSAGGTVCTLALGSLASNEADTAVFAVNVLNPAPAGLAQLSNTATIGDDGTNGGDLTPQNNSANETTPLVAAPDMQISKSDGGVIVKAGGTITYSLSYTNAGNQGATGVVITETVPANTSFKVSGSSAGWTCTPNINAGSTCRLNIGAVAGGNGGGSAIFIIGVANPLPGAVTAITNTVQIGDDGANGADLTPSNNQVSKSTIVDQSLPQQYFYLPIMVKN
jgi:uncharacterized repeat protein (TIGR01451 family)